MVVVICKWVVLRFDNTMSFLQPKKSNQVFILTNNELFKTKTRLRQYPSLLNSLKN